MDYLETLSTVVPPGITTFVGLFQDEAIMKDPGATTRSFKTDNLIVAQPIRHALAWPGL